MNYAVMSRDLDSYYLNSSNYAGRQAIDWYEQHKDLILSPSSYLYGAVLVRLKPVRVGLRVELRFYRRMLWRPAFTWNRFTRHFHWLFLSVSFSPIFDEKPDEVVCDHLKKVVA